MKRLPSVGSIMLSAVCLASPVLAQDDPSAGRQFDYGNYTSQTLTTNAWAALALKDVAAVDAYATKCIALYSEKALEQSMALQDFAASDEAFNYWALNDVATSYFIRGRAHAMIGSTDKAREDFSVILEHFPYAQAWDTKGWFWKVAEGAKDQLNTLGTTYDFGDYTSQTLTTKAWEALETRDYTGVEIYAKKCVELYDAEARKQQAFLTEFAPKEKAFNYWALNDVGTSYFILGQGLEAQGRAEEAKRAFQTVIEQLEFAQCWDPRGWFWKVAVASRGRLNKLLADSEAGSLSAPAGPLTP